MNKYAQEIKLFIAIGMVSAIVAIAAWFSWVRITSLVTTYSPYLIDTFNQETPYQPYDSPQVSPFPAIVAATPTVVPSLRPLTTSRSVPTPSPRANRTTQQATTTRACSGVEYQNNCYQQTCIDLDAKNMVGTDGDQYYTASRIYWVPESRMVQFVNEDYCDPTTGELIEYYCTADGQAGSIRVSESKCLNNKL